MEDNDDKLSNFIRKKLQTVVGNNDAWDMPDASVWQKAKLGFLQPEKERKRISSFWFYGLLGAILLLLSVLYNWRLVQTKNQVKEQFEEQSEIVAQLKEQLAEDNKTQQILYGQNLNIIKKLRLDNERLVQENEQMNKERKQLKHRFQTLIYTQHDLINKTELSIQQKEPNGPEQSLSKQTIAPEKNQSSEIIKLSPLPINHIYNKPQSELVFLFSPEPKPLKFPKEEQRNKNELGINFSLSFLRMPSSLVLEKGEKKMEQTTEDFAPSYYLYYAHSIKNNWWLKTGVAYANYSYTNNFQFKSEYDKSKEFEKSDGTLANELPFQTENGYFRTTQNIQMDIPDNANLETGDFIFGEFEESQRINAWSFPFGVEYRHQKNKFGWQIETSLLLNLLTFSETNLSGKIQSTQTELPIEIVNKTYNPSSSKLLFGVQGGIGLNYRLYKNLSLRADVLFQYNPHFLNQNIQMGLGYKF
ncbi:MAG: hypothetical protein ACI9JY_002250 [Saprospiraceae bacterium]|jgi:hypothetical protein